MIGKKINVLSIGYSYQEINEIQDELAKEFSHFRFDFALSVRDSLYRLNLSDYDFVILELTSSDIDHLVALKDIFQNKNGLKAIVTLESEKIPQVSHIFGSTVNYVVAKDGYHVEKIVQLIKNIVNNDNNILNHEFVTTFDQNLIQVLVNGLSEGLIFCDLKNDIILVNRSAEKLLGVDREELLGKSIINLPIENGQQWLNKILKFAQSNINFADFLKFELVERRIELRFIPIYKNSQYVGGFLYLTNLSSHGTYDESYNKPDTDIASLPKFFSSNIVAKG